MILVFLQICYSFSPSNNPLFKKQYFIKNDGSVFNGIADEDLNIVPAWEQGSTGEGVRIVIINDGCQANHNELTKKFDFNYSYNYHTNTNDPSYDPRQFITSTGTKLATIVAGEDDDICGIGIAFNSTVSCINVLTSTQAQLKYQEAIKRDNNVKRSIRLFPSFSQYQSGVNYLATFDEAEEKLFEQFEAIYITYVQNGNVQSNEDYNYLYYPGNPYVFTFAEISQRGSLTSSSLHGNVVLASVVTGGGDYDSNTASLSAYISTGDGFGQICSETVLPRYTGGSMASGVISLILSSTTEPLKSNDIAIIIALTSVKNDPHSKSWKTNKKGIRYSSIYGFGRLDAGAAVSMAKSYHHKEKAKPETATFVSNHFSLPITFPSFLSGFFDVELELKESKIKYIDFVELIMKFTDKISDYSLFRIFLISPSGTERMVKDVGQIYEPDIHRYRISVRDFLGEEAIGKWKVRFLRENIGSPDYRLEEISLKVTGYEDDDFPSQSQKEGSNPFQTYKTVDANLTIQLPQTSDDVPKIQCNQLFTFKVESENDRIKKFPTVPFDLMMTQIDDKGPFERFGVGPVGTQNQAAVYCMYKEGKYKLRAVNPSLQVATNDITVDLINPGSDDYSDTGFGEIQQYRTIPLTYQQLGYTLIPISIIRDVRQSLSNYKVGYFVLATLWDTETDEIYSTQLTQSIGGQYIYTGSKPCEKCVLTVVPYGSEDLVGKMCNTFVNTLSIVDAQKKMTVNSKFEIEWKNVCPVPMGIETKESPTETASPTTQTESESDSFSPSASMTPTESLKPTYYKLSTKMILIIAGSSCAVVILIVVIVYCLLRRKKSLAALTTEQILSAPLLDSKVI